MTARLYAVADGPPQLPADIDEPLGGAGVVWIEHRGSDCPVIAARGELDCASEGALERALHTGCRGATRIAVDLGRVSFMDLSTLRRLLRADAELAAAGGGVVLVAASRPVRRLLELTGQLVALPAGLRPERLP